MLIYQHLNDLSLLFSLLFILYINILWVNFFLQGEFIMANKKIIKEVHTVEDSDGNITVDTKETVVQALQEPDYIKLYTNMWCEFKDIPVAYRNLFLELVMRMTYCNSTDLEHSQLVNTGKPWNEEIMQKLGWKSNMYQKGLKLLCDFGAIKKVNRGVYQINPQFAGKGAWKYNPKLNQGGVKDLVATFNFREKSVDVHVLCADDGENNEMNEMMREGLEVTKDQETTLTHMTVKNDISA